MPWRRNGKRRFVRCTHHAQRMHKAYACSVHATGRLTNGAFTSCPFPTRESPVSPPRDPRSPRDIPRPRPPARGQPEAGRSSGAQGRTPRKARESPRRGAPAGRCASADRESAPPLGQAVRAWRLCGSSVHRRRTSAEEGRSRAPIRTSTSRFATRGAFDTVEAWRHALLRRRWKGVCSAGRSDAGTWREVEPSLGPDAIRAALERVLASADFDASERNRNFLRHVVEETLAGRAERIKAYNIATTVFGRDDRFDPQLELDREDRGGPPPPVAGALLPDQRPGRSGEDRRSQGILRSHLRGARAGFDRALRRCPARGRWGRRCLSPPSTRRAMQPSSRLRPWLRPGARRRPDPVHRAPGVRRRDGAAHRCIGAGAAIGTRRRLHSHGRNHGRP